MSILSYKTILKEAEAEYTEKKSRFIAYIHPAEQEEAAIAFLNAVKSKHWDARHNVFAYRTGFGSAGTQRYSDDGEPQGTAGMPILDVIQKQELYNLIIVVTRYFGGVLLGSAGLVRAYGKSASMGIQQAGIIQRVLCDVVRIEVTYPLFGLLQRELPKRGYAIKEVLYGEIVTLLVYVKRGEYPQFEQQVIEMTNASCLLEKQEAEYQTLDINH